VYGNPVAEQYLGLKQGQLAGRHICDVFGTEQGQQRLAMIPQILAGQVTHFEDKLTIDGKALYFDIHCWPLHTDSGQKRRVLLFAADITKSKKTQEALHRSEELFRTIFNSSNDCIVIWDRNYQFIDANTSAVAFMRRERSQVVGHRLDEMLGWNPEYLAQWKGRIDRVFQTGQPERVEDRLFYEDQEHYSESVLFPLRNHQDAVFAVGAVYRDVTDNRKAVMALAESEHRFRSLADAAFEGIVIHDHGKIVDCNQRYAEMASYSREELIGRNVMELIHPEDRNNIHGVKQPDYPHLYTARMMCGDGSIRTVEYQGRSIQWEGRQLRVASARDITQRQKMEQELAQTRQRLQELHRQMYLGSMLAFLAHELNQPLTVMELTLSESLRYCNDTDTGQAMRDIIENNLRQIHRATEIIQKFRRFFKMASFDTEQIISIEPVVQRVKMSLLDSARQARIEIVLDPSLKDLPDLIFSDLAMEQICMVLMQNAVDAADPNRSNRLVISGRLADHGVELLFADDCGGVSQTMSEPILEPFFTTKTGSLGLGLEIVRRILSACGGSIRLDNEQGQGCCFIVQIPFTA
jgi:PAS domain S-box-containing protein